MANEYIVSNDAQISGSLSVSQSVTADTYYGDGSHLTGITGSQWDGIFTGSVEITGSIRLIGGKADFRLGSGVSGSFSGSFQGNGAGLTNLNLNGYQASGSNLTGSFTGSFAGDGSKLTGITASFYNGPTLNAISASYASTASYYSGSVVSASYATTASYSATASYFAGVVQSSLTASYVNPLKQQVQITGSLAILGTETVSSTLQVGGKIQSQTGIDILNPNGVYWKDSSFGSTALGGVGYNQGIGFYASSLVTPRLFISESGNIGIGTITPTLARLQVAGNVLATSFTGSLQGTASYTSGSVFTSANPALSASYALSSSYALSASRAISSSYALTSSYVTGSIHTSANPALSASYALTASYALNGGGSAITHLEYNNTDLTVWNNGKANLPSNTSFGDKALASNTTGTQNTAFGVSASFTNTTGSDNTAIGFSALRNNTTGYNNVAIGTTTLANNISGFSNTGVGTNTLGVCSGFANTSIGSSGLGNLTTGYWNTGIGYGTSLQAATNMNSTVIGANAIGLGSNTTVIGHTDTTLTAIRGNIAIGKDSANSKLDVSGSITVTGSMRGQVSALSIVSTTASMDLATNNFFTLTLVSGSTTHISASNIQPGQTVNLRLIQSSVLSGSVSFHSAIKQPSGSAYTASAVVNAVDIMSFIAFDSTALYSTAIKNLI